MLFIHTSWNTSLQKYTHFTFSSLQVMYRTNHIVLDILSWERIRLHMLIFLCTLIPKHMSIQLNYLLSMLYFIYMYTLISKHMSIQLNYLLSMSYFIYTLISKHMSIQLNYLLSMLYFTPHSWGENDTNRKGFWGHSISLIPPYDVLVTNVYTCFPLEFGTLLLVCIFAFRCIIKQCHYYISGFIL